MLSVSSPVEKRTEMGLYRRWARFRGDQAGGFWSPESVRGSYAGPAVCFLGARVSKNQTQSQPWVAPECERI